MANDTTVGAVFIVLGALGVVENALTAYFMATDTHMRNPTYFYMINLCIADGLILILLELYSGLSLVWPELAPPWAMRIAGFLTITTWYATCILLTLTCFSRYIQLEMSEKVPVYFTRTRLISSVCAAWIISACIYLLLLFSSDLYFTFFRGLYLWGFDRTTTVGNIYYIQDLSFDMFIALLINVFNFLSLLSIRKRRKQVQLTTNTSGNLKREIKLFVQCGVTGCMFTMLSVFYMVMHFVGDTNHWYEFLLCQLFWAMHHMQNPVIYFCLNTRLRQRFLEMFR